MAQTYSLSPWSLSDLFPSLDSAEMKAAFDRLEAEVEQFESRRQQLTADITNAAFMQIVKEYEKINNQAYRIYGFANLLFTSDTQDQAATASWDGSSNLWLSCKTAAFSSACGGKKLPARPELPRRRALWSGRQV